ncbi:hypothetical protein SAMD00019534_107800 [Acytostelium subglobosum LB1]|uniref:hypothetical protein n=1 Tax=Acytostelium subglobosum LB1 TaxID=1410327 RepID=UPI0006451F36|nr:hypothetical protein SAMD00019534_107800 [Acytostelium subglobosum LB1]GAM27604.1 hypothetical protein SAMD00019534_107800 [Acytostelium subglobosum LB1]|eukprot:XP_012749263.1 hypothetical protein SAMD00019534_107800 [Acytostelium subglobosum LB1]
MTTKQSSSSSQQSSFSGQTLDSLSKMGVSTMSSRSVEENVINSIDQAIAQDQIRELTKKLNKVRNEISSIQDFIEKNHDHIKATTFAPKSAIDPEEVINSLIVLKTLKQKRLDELNAEERKLNGQKKKLEEDLQKMERQKKYKPANSAEFNAPSSLDRAFGFGGQSRENEKERLIRMGKITPFANVQQSRKAIVIPVMDNTSQAGGGAGGRSSRLDSGGRYSSTTRRSKGLKPGVNSAAAEERHEKRKKWMENANKQHSKKSTTFYDDLKNDDIVLSDEEEEEEIQDEDVVDEAMEVDNEVNEENDESAINVDGNEDPVDVDADDDGGEEHEEDDDDDDDEVMEVKDDDEDYIDEEEEEEEEEEDNRSKKNKKKEKISIDIHQELWRDDANESNYQDRLYLWKKDRLRKQTNYTNKLLGISNRPVTTSAQQQQPLDESEMSPITTSEHLDENIDVEDEDAIVNLLNDNSQGELDDKQEIENEQVLEEEVAELDKSLEEQDDDDEFGEDFQVDGDFKIPYEVYHRLFEYQVTCVKWMWELHNQECGGIIGDEMGLGKTVQIISFLASLHYSKMLGGPALIIAPATLLSNWVKEIHTWWPPFRAILYHSSGTSNKDKKTMKQLIETVASKGHILMTTYESVRINQDTLLKHHWEYIILDEGHKIRNPDADVTLSVKQFPTSHRIILSGSPIQNKLTELWSLFDFVFPGKLGTLPIFKTQFAVPISLGGYANASTLQVQTAYQCAVALRNLISPYMLRRIKADVLQSLPSKNEQVLLCPLTPFQEREYLKFLASNEATDVLDGKKNLLYAIDILKKVCNHPDILLKDGEDKPYDYGNVERSAKLKVVQQILPMWQQQGHKVLLFCQTRQMLDIVESFIVECGLTYRRMDGTTSVKTRQSLVEEFNQDPTLFIFLLTTKVGGLGINLTGANRVILFDPDWNPSTDIQARERVYRIGQLKSVTIYRLMTTGTIEEKIYHRQIYKQFLSNKILKDPRQKRFFRSRHFKDLLSYNKVVKGSETGDIFNGTNSEILPEDFAASQQRKRGNSGVDSPPAADADSPTYQTRPYQPGGGSNDNNNDDETKESEDAYILKHLFEKEGLKSALKHDSIMEQSGPEASLLENEATKIANKAVELIKLSRAKIESQGNRLSTPTWTGRSGTSGIPSTLAGHPLEGLIASPPPATTGGRFGNKNKAIYTPASPTLQPIVSIIPDNKMNNNNKPLVGQAGKASLDSSAILSTLQQSDIEKASEMFGGIKPSDIIKNIFDFLMSKGGNSTTQAIIDHFALSISADQAPLFRSLLKSVAVFSKTLKLWTIKPDL